MVGGAYRNGELPVVDWRETRLDGHPAIADMVSLMLVLVSLLVLVLMMMMMLFSSSSNPRVIG